MLSLRTGLMTGAVLALAGCTSGGYYDDGYYDGYPAVVSPYPYSPYYDSYYGYGGYRHFDDDDDDRFFQPSRHIKCDRVRKVCFDDRDGLSYEATRRYFGDHEGRFDDDDRFFQPSRHIKCDRVRNVCFDDRDGLSYDATRRYFGNKAERKARNAQEIPTASLDDADDDDAGRVRPRILNRSGDEDEEVWLVKPRRQGSNDDDKPVTRRLFPSDSDDSHGMIRSQTDDDEPSSRSTRQSDPESLKRLMKPQGGGACPPKGCTD
jgi:hypothetical protein